ncbi:MAG: DUF1963 domain-containing protein [Pseudomonadota bacterium]
MIGFLKWLLGLQEVGGATPMPLQSHSTQPTLLPLPEEVAKDFLDWFKAQQKPAVALKPDPTLPIEPRGTRLFGPALLVEGEEWPKGRDGETLDFLAQLNLADCAPLDGYPRQGLVQFFIGRDVYYGANFDGPGGLDTGNFLVRGLPVDVRGALHTAPHAGTVDSSGIDDYSPSNHFELRKRGITLVPKMITDQMGLDVLEASQRFYALDRKTYDLDPLYDAIDTIIQDAPLEHHTAGYPAFTQSDIREDERYAEYDHVLLRLTSDDYLMWGDVGECVFMIPSADLAKGDFGRVAYSWDCH